MERVVPVHRLSKGGGRPSKYDVKFCESAARMCAEGATDLELAQAFDIALGTFYRWQHEHPEFRESLKIGKEAPDNRVERTLYHRAIGYSYPAVKIMQDKGFPVVIEYIEHVPPDVGAATLWLTNRRPDNWRQKQSLEHSGSIEHVDTHRDLSADEIVALVRTPPK